MLVLVEVSEIDELHFLQVELTHLLRHEHAFKPTFVSHASKSAEHLSMHFPHEPKLLFSPPQYGSQLFIHAVYFGQHVLLLLAFEASKHFEAHVSHLLCSLYVPQ